MSWSDEEIDDLFREAGQKISVPPYQDAFFGEFEKLLPKKKKRRFGLWFIFTTLALTGLSTGIYFSSNSVSVNSDSSQTVGKKSPLAQVNNNKPTTDDAAKQIPEKISIETNTTPINTEVSNPIKKSNTIQTNENQSNKSFKITEKLKGLNSESEKPLVLDEKRESGKTDFLKYKTLLLPVFPLANTQIGMHNFKKPGKAQPHRFYTELGYAVSAAYLIPENKTAKPMNAFALETGYQYQQKKWAFGVGLRYQISKPNDLELTRESKVYGLDVSYYGQRIEFKSISSFELPLQFSIIRGNHRFGIAATPSFNAGATIQFTKTKNGEEIENSTFYFNKTGMRSFGFKPEISYQVNLKSNLELGINLSVQTINPLQNDKFAGTLNTGPFAGQIHIRKYINFK